MLPDMRVKVELYLLELEKEIERCEKMIKHYVDMSELRLVFNARLEALTEVKNDLRGRLEERI